MKNPTIFVLIAFTFLLTTQCSYDKQWSRILNRFSAVTHCSIEQIASWSCRICKEGEKLTNIQTLYNQVTNVLGFIGYLQSKNTIILSMRGTMDFRNWIEDLTYKQVNYAACKGCLIHEGFYLDYLSISSKVNAVVKTFMEKYPSAKIIVTGSSLGGALATVAALQLQASTGIVDELHAFGCPRVGNDNYAQYISLKIPTIYRVVHNKDIVPHVPLVSQNYHHPPYQILFDENMITYKTCDSSGQDPNCSNSYYPNFSIPDHTSYWYKPVQADVCN